MIIWDNFIKNVNIIFGITGAFNTFPKIIEKIKELAISGANIYPIMSYYSYYICTKFYNKYIEEIEKITKQKIIHTIRESESLPKKINSNIMIIAPTTGNTIAKLANSISDTSITIAVKSHIKDKKPLVIFIYTNDG